MKLNKNFIILYIDRRLCMIKSIRKRDGRLVDFEVDKIAGALYKAFSACFS